MINPDVRRCVNLNAVAVVFSPSPVVSVACGYSQQSVTSGTNQVNLTNLEITDNDIVRRLQAKPALINLTGRSDTDNGLVVGDGDLVAKRRGCDSAAHFDDIFPRGTGIFLQVIKGRNRHDCASIAAGGSAIERSKTVRIVLASSQNCDRLQSDAEDCGYLHVGIKFSQRVELF